MKFTIEKEIKNTVNFLDVTVQNATEIISFNTYRKPTLTNTISPSDSCHPPEHKYGATNYIANRMNTDQLNKFNKELECNIIKQIIYNSNYDLSVLNKLNRTKQKTRRLGKNTYKCVSFTYVREEKKFITKIV